LKTQSAPGMRKARKRADLILPFIAKNLATLAVFFSLLSFFSYMAKKLQTPIIFGYKIFFPQKNV
jgi:hypothetical protein